MHSAYGYSVGWFASALSEDYLCSKFLEIEYNRKYAEQHLAYLLENAEELELTEEQVEQIRNVCEFELESFEAFGDFMVSIDRYDDVVDGCAMGYDPDNARTLVAIQKRFSGLYAQHNRM